MNQLNYKRIVGVRKRLDFPSLSVLIKITDLLGLGLDELVFGAGLKEVRENNEEKKAENTRRKTKIPPYH